MNSFKSRENFKRRVWARLYSFEYESQRKDTVISSFNKGADKKTDINPNGVQITKTCLEYMVNKFQCSI